MFAQEHLRRKETRDVMYRSNSSLDLIYIEHPSTNGLRREYGSHGSIDVIGDRAPGMVHAYNGLPGPEKPAGLGRPPQRIADIMTTDHADGPLPRPSASPKPRLKFNKLWGGATPNMSRQTLEDTTIVENDAKRKLFAHYDCQSLMANLSYAAEARGMLLSRRRNTTTGASAASLLAARGAPPGDITVPDTGDGRSNELIDSCPFFRNEVGGEEERCVSLCWKTSRGAIPNQSGGWHRPKAAYGLSVLEYPPGSTHWKHGCPFGVFHNTLPIESQDLGALYYRNYFYTQPHQNWFGMDESLGPVAISIRKERVELRRGTADTAAPASLLAWQYRLVIRTSELLTLRGSVLEDHLPATKPSNNSATYNTKEVLEYVAPELQFNCLRLGVSNNGAEEQLLRLDEQCLTKHYKVGVMYCKAGQSTEEEMYNNQEAGPAFVEFLQTLGQTVRLKDFDKYKAGLDNKTDSTGLYSVYTTYQGCEIMFHVSTMLPYTPNNRQQLLRKRHIGNDIVTIVFQEPGAAPFTPRNIRSQFQHVFVVVRAIDPCSDNTYYSIAVSRAKEVPLFGPPIKEGAVYPKGVEFTDLLLAKVINGENAAIQSPKFSTMATRTRQEYLKDLAKNYVTSTTLDTGQKFSIFSSLLSKGSNHSNCSLVQKPDAGINDVLVAGAFYFHVQLQDEGSGGSLLDCVMGISADTIVFVEETTRQIVLVLPTDSILGWVVSASGWCLRLYYHRGETVRVVGGGGGGGAALRARLATVAPPRAEPCAELALERGTSSQLGFHVRTDGLVSGVSAGGVAARAGVRAGARLLEVCRAAVTALPHHALLDLLGTADPVTITISYASGRACECDSDGEGWGRGGARGEVPRVNRRGDSSGYGTGSSGRSEGRTDPVHSSYGTGSSTRSVGQNDPPHSNYGTGSSTRSVGQNEPPLSNYGTGSSTRSTGQTDPPHSGYGTGSTGRSEGRNDPAPVPRRRSHDDRVRHSRHSANTASLTEELMRLMDAELGEGRVSAGGGGAAAGTPRGGGGSASPRGGGDGGGGGSASPRALPLPDAGALDWSALVHTATRAMLQICEEHQYPSLDTTEQSLDASLVEPTQDNWPESTTPVSEWNCMSAPPVPPPPGAVPAAAPDSPSLTACGCGLANRVSTLEADAAAAARHRHHLEDEVRRLRRHNARLREESARAVWQLRHFTQWLKRTVDRQ